MELSQTRTKLESPQLQHLTHPKYRPDIDGLRALAVLLVVAFHAFPRAIPGGFVGVDIFFVISGYLISTIIFGNLEHNSFSYAEFYARRIRRIFPALALVLTVSVALGWFILFEDEYQQLGRQIVAGAGFVSNFALWNETGYFDNDAYAKPLLHLWSLGIEEQFYILWPLLLGFVWRRKYNFLTITLAIAIASFVSNVLIIGADPVAAFYSPWSRFWELMVGGFLAYLTLHRAYFLPSKPNWQSAVGLLLILASAALLNKEAAFPGWWALLPAIGAFFMISAGTGAWLNQKLLSNRGMVWIGLISYPLYLWHWVLFSFSWIVRKGRMPPVWDRVALVLISFLLAYLTYYFLEKRVRSGGRNIVIILAGAVVAVLLTGLIMNLELIHPRNHGKTIEPIMQALYDGEYSGFQRVNIKGASVKSKKAGAKTVLFIGDSHIDQYGPRVTNLLENNSKKYNSALFLIGLGCVPIPGSAQLNKNDIEGCEKFRHNVARLILEPDANAIVIGAAWNLYFLTSGARYSNNLDLEFELGNIERFIKSISARKKVYFVLDNPSGPQFDPRNFFEGSRLTNLTIKPFQKPIPLDKDQSMLRDRLAQIATRAGATVIDPVFYLCPGNNCPTATTDGKPIYRDGNHYRPFYVKENADFIDVALE